MTFEPQAGKPDLLYPCKKNGRKMTDSPIHTIGFDADDTLWHHERYFQLTQKRFAELLADFAEPDQLEQKLLAAEKRNVEHYGFGIKGFTLSMIETALEISKGDLPGAVIGEILEAGREMLNHPIEPLPGAQDALEALKSDFTLVLVTKGDMIDQERKLAQSGLGEFFDAVEIVSNKTENTYRNVFARHGSGPQSAMMVGNSLASDVLPALRVGAWAVHVPSDFNWALDHADEPTEAERFRLIAHLGELTPLIHQLK